MQTDYPPQPTRIIVLSDGPANVTTGAWPDRTIDVVTRAEVHAFEVATPKAAVLVCAGGGYLRLMLDREGTEIATWLNGQGYNAYVLVHRLPGEYPFDIALTDGLAALSVLPDLPVFLMGLSSGGHLAGSLACQPLPCALLGLAIAYAPINANHRNYKAPADKPDYPPLEKQMFYDAWPIGLKAEPHGVPDCPVFLAYALHDQAVPIEHMLNFILTARDVGLDLDAHVFAQAPHGFALRDVAGTHRVWTDLLRDWLDRKAVSGGQAIADVAP